MLMTFPRRSTFPTDLTGRVEAESTFEVANLDDSGVWRRRWSVLCLRLKKVCWKVGPASLSSGPKVGGGKSGTFLFAN